MARPTLRPHRLLAFSKTVILALALSATPPFVAPSAALDAAIVKGLKELDLNARLEQRCDIEAMSRIAKDKKGYRPDRVVAGATAETKIDGDSIEGDGAAFRSKGKWYQLSYVCRTSDDHMDVLDFNYKIGEAIPENDWEKFGLWE
jgi:Domain of Unknown Function (DUF930)